MYFYIDLDLHSLNIIRYLKIHLSPTTDFRWNAANEVLVNEFLEDKIGFYDIPYYIEKTLEAHNSISEPTVEDILEIDRWTREFVVKSISK